MLNVKFPKLTSYQQEVYEWMGDCYKSGKVAVLKSVRQSGKTFLIQVEVLRMAFEHKSVSVIYEPTLALARNVYKSISKALENTGLVTVSNGQLLEIELVNGSTILFKSTEQMSRGLTVSGILVLDECAYLDDEAIYSILPLVNANNAPILIASTPFVMDGYYYQMFLKGLGEDKKIRTFDWAKSKDISQFLTEEKKALYKQTMSKAKYTTEIMGEFLTNGGLLFTGMENCIDDNPALNPYLYVGIDFGTGSEKDYTVISVFNGNGNMVGIHRTNNLSPMQQVEWIAGIINDYEGKYTIRKILAEENSIGKVYIDALKGKIHSSITNWITSNSSKQDLVTLFQCGMENGYLTLLNNPVLLNEIRKYQADVNSRTKTITYNGYNCNDDTVIATMLAYYAYKKSLGSFRISLV